MEAKISKAQIEVWEWKDSANDQIKNLSKEDRLKFILAQTKDLAKRLRSKKAA